MLTANYCRLYSAVSNILRNFNIYLGASVDDLMMEQVIEGTVNIAAAVRGTLLVLTGTLLLILLHRIFRAKNWKNQSAVPGELKPIRFTGSNLPTGSTRCDVLGVCQVLAGGWVSARF